jgi:hypothetical protein
METFLGIGALALAIGAYVAYTSWLTNGIKPRAFDTELPAERLRTLFAGRVARMGWKVVDDGNPMVAQSSLATGIRQQVALNLRAKDGRTSAIVGPRRWVTRWGVPKKAHTIRMRLDGFMAAVQAEDRRVHVRTGEVRGR